MKSVAQIKSNFTVIRDAGRTMTSLVHESAASIIGHVLMHGDVTLADSLLDAMGNGARRQALVNWFSMFGPMSYDVKTGKFKVSKARKVEMLDAMAANAWADMLEALDPCIVDIDGNSVKRWDEYTKESVKAAPWDVTDYLETVLKTLDKHGVVGDVVETIKAAQAKARVNAQLAAFEQALAE